MNAAMTSGMIQLITMMPPTAAWTRREQARSRKARASPRQTCPT